MGLGASVWSTNTETADRLARQLEAGTIWINSHFEMDLLAPFGAWKENRMGVDLGWSGLKGLCDSQTLMVFKKV